MSFSSTPRFLRTAIKALTFTSFSLRASSKFGFFDSMVAVIVATFGVTWAFPIDETEIVSVGFVCQGLSQKAPKAISKTTSGQIRALPFLFLAILGNYKIKSRRSRAVSDYLNLFLANWIVFAPLVLIFEFEDLKFEFLSGFWGGARR